jgi:membrane protein YdbS with pleckstrin-like domain
MDDRYRPLDPRVVRLWRIDAAIVTAVVLAIVLVPLGLTIAAGASTAAIALSIAWVALAAAGLWQTLWYPQMAYRAFGFRVDERVLEIRSGVLVRVERLLPLSRLQHVDVRRGPLERANGLATLILHTAGTREASMRIPGLAADEAVRLRDHLVAVGGDDAV